MTSTQVAEIILEVINNEDVFIALSAWATLIISAGVTLGIVCFKVLENFKESLK